LRIPTFCVGICKSGVWRQGAMLNSSTTQQETFRRTNSHKGSRVQIPPFRLPKRLSLTFLS